MFNAEKITVIKMIILAIGNNRESNVHMAIKPIASLWLTYKLSYDNHFFTLNITGNYSKLE
jgi:hypothetical protein